MIARFNSVFWGGAITASQGGAITASQGGAITAFRGVLLRLELI